jgi:hypothetical protein
MNERIRELEKQSYTEVMHEMGGTYMAFDKEKFAELIVRECVACCGSQADMKSIRKRFGLPIESDIKYSAPEAQGHQSQYGREYDTPT